MNNIQFITAQARALAHREQIDLEVAVETICKDMCITHRAVGKFNMRLLEKKTGLQIDMTGDSISLRPPNIIEEPEPQKKKHNLTDKLPPIGDSDLPLGDRA